MEPAKCLCSFRDLPWLGQGKKEEKSDAEETTPTHIHRRAGSSGLCSVTEKPEAPRSSACSLYTVEQGGGLLHMAEQADGAIPYS